MTVLSQATSLLMNLSPSLMRGYLHKTYMSGNNSSLSIMISLQNCITFKDEKINKIDLSWSDWLTTLRILTNILFDAYLVFYVASHIRCRNLCMTERAGVRCLYVIISVRGDIFVTKVRCLKYYVSAMLGVILLHQEPYRLSLTTLHFFHHPLYCVWSGNGSERHSNSAPFVGWQIEH